jgi:ATP-binding cassette subfamily F protein uup
MVKQKNKTPSEKKTVDSKRSFKDQFELDNLPKEIEKLETQLNELNNLMTQTDFYQQESFQVKQIKQKHNKFSQLLEEKYQRWDELEN